jgi:hypothetical protein
MTAAQLGEARAAWGDRPTTGLTVIECRTGASR